MLDLKSRRNLGFASALVSALFLFENNWAQYQPNDLIYTVSNQKNFNNSCRSVGEYCNWNTMCCSKLVIKARKRVTNSLRDDSSAPQQLHYGAAAKITRLFRVNIF